MIPKNDFKITDISNYDLKATSFYMKEFDDNFEMWMHKHNYLEIMYVNSGKFTLEVALNNDPNNVIKQTLTQGQFVLLDCSVFHNMIIEKNEKAFVYNLEFSPVDKKNENEDLLSINYDKILGSTKILEVIKNEGFIISYDFEQVGTILKNLIILLDSASDSIECKLSINVAIVNLFLEISKCLNKEKLGSYSYIRKANKYILENYSKKISIDDIAEYSGVSKSYLEHQYKKQMKQTILSSINVIRVQKASKYLTTTSYPINEIAKKVGFKDKNQLNYEFKKIIKVTPKEYRENIRKEERIDFFNKNHISVFVKPKEQK